jgi:hypothetical protein
MSLSFPYQSPPPCGFETEAIVDQKRNRDLALVGDLHWGVIPGGAPSISLGDYYTQGNHEKKKCRSLGVNGLPKGESYLILSGWGLERSQQRYARFT